MTAIPDHKLLESPNSRTIEIGVWEITAKTNPISNATECDALQASLSGLPLPEMTFGNNSLELIHKPSGWSYSFTTKEALQGVRNGELLEGDGGVKVGYADAWLKSRYVFLREDLRTGLHLANVAQVPHRIYPCQQRFSRNRMIGPTLRPTVAMKLILHFFLGDKQTRKIVAMRSQ